MISDETDFAARVKQSVGLELTLDESGRPKLLSPLGSPKWPNSLAHHRTVVMDTTPTEEGEFWPAPRFEILIANLDALGISVIQVGDPTSDRLSRATYHYKKLSSEDRAGVISMCLLWIGLNTTWRIIAAAVGKPQIVIAYSESQVMPRWDNTFVANAKAHAPESKALGPISVMSVAEATTNALKFVGASFGL